MSAVEQVLEISASTTSFTAVCERCAVQNAAEGFTSSTFAGRLDLDLDDGTFLCRRGHQVRVERTRATASGSASAEAAA